MSDDRIKRQVWSAKIVTVITIAGILVSFALPEKIRILANIVLMLTLLYHLLFSWYKKIVYPSKMQVPIWMFEIALTVFYLANECNYYEFLGSETLPFLFEAIFIGIICGVIAILFFLKFEGRITGKLTQVIVTIFLCSFMAWFTLPNLNYALDTHKAQAYSVVIARKNLTKNPGGKFRTYESYEFVFRENGEERFIGVPEAVYDKYKSGDQFELLVYKGAFGKEFYISKDIEN